jgi:23S rRNA (cytidine2498-2'-O)-methyltransferase
MSARYVFVVTQPGSERPLKNEIAREHPALRFAFSRPGFVTFRVSDTAALGAGFRLRSVFARTWGFSLGKINGADDVQLVRAAWHLIDTQLGEEPLEHVHVWPRERPLPGDEEFDGAAEDLARAIGERLVAQGRPPRTQAAVNAVATAGERVLDCVLVEPNEWWLGTHVAADPETRWPGGVPPIAAPERPISRAYFKIVEALEWSELPIAAGDRCVEIGSAPGGSALALLERGLLVAGVDPAEMDQAVLSHPGFTHLRARAKDVKRSVFRGCRWLVMDANVAPSYTLDTLDGVLTQGGARPEGLVLTLKLTDAALAESLPALADRIRRHGYRRVRLRQLAFNRREVCAVATDRT